MKSSDTELSLAVFLGANKAMCRWPDQPATVHGIIALEFINGVQWASQMLVLYDGGITAHDMTRGVAIASKTLGTVMKSAEPPKSQDPAPPAE
jgi:hypothetical protein